MMSSRREFIKNTGSLTIGFCLTGFKTSQISHARQLSHAGKTRLAATTITGPGDLPGDLQDNPRIDSWLQILEDGRVRVLTGKLELGQGIRTAVAQVAAEELGLEMHQIEVEVAETGITPDEGYTAGSNSIEASAIAIRYAAAAAREKLLNGRQLTDEVRMPVKLKPKDQHVLIGKPIKRPDNELIVYGKPYYVQDLDFPDMVHGAVIRPPSYGATLKSVDKNPIPNVLAIIQNGSFLAVIARNQYDALKASKQIQAEWIPGPALPTFSNLPDYLRTLPVKTEKVAEKGTINNTPTIKASYSKPYIMHGAIGPSCAIAKYENGKLDVWSHSQGVFPLRESIAAMLDIKAENIHIKGVAGSGCYGHNGADDAAADAALMAVNYPGKHIQVQWTRDDEHGWEPYGSAMLMDLEAALDEKGQIKEWKYALYSDTHGARPSGHAENLLPARYLEKPFTAKPSGFSGGAYRNAEPYYTIPNLDIQANFFDGPLRASSLRSLGAFANIFAIESFMDELAIKAGKDPFEFRLQHLGKDDRAKQVLQKLKAITQSAREHSQASPPADQIGIAFSRYKNGGTYCAVAAQVSVNKNQVEDKTKGETKNEVKVEKLWAVVDAGEVINLDGIKNQIEGGMMQSTSWTLLEQVLFDEHHVTSRQWATYPVLHIHQAPKIEVVIIDRPTELSLGAGEASQGPTAAAITNAIYKVAGIRIRHLPVNVHLTSPPPQS